MKVRKQREVAFARKRSSKPTVRVEHAVQVCPECESPLSQGSVWRTREVVEIVPNPAVVAEHVYIERDCPVCATNCKPEPQLEGVVVGKRRFGVGLVSLIATLREKLRLPIRQIRWYLKTYHELQVSTGAIVDALRTVAERGAGQVEQILGAIRSSRVVDADETGWSEPHLPDRGASQLLGLDGLELDGR